MNNNTNEGVHLVEYAWNYSRWLKLRGTYDHVGDGAGDRGTKRYQP